MPTYIAADELVAALKNAGRGLAACALDSPVQRCVANLQAAGTTLRDGDDDTVALRGILRRAAQPLVTPAAHRLLSTAPIFALNDPLCNAMAHETRDGDPFILICGGLLSVFAYRIGLWVLAGNVHHMLLRRDPTTTERARFSELLGKANALAYWYFLTGEPETLPGFTDLFSEVHRDQLVQTMAIGLSFVAMHEIGHVALGHLKDGSVPAAQVHAVLDCEDSSALKQMELEADRFAISCFVEPLRAGVSTSLFMVLDLISDVECFFFGFARSHPLVINRIRHLADLTRVHDDAFLHPRLEKMLAVKRNFVMESREIAQENEKHDINAVQALAALRAALPQPDECQRAVESLKAMYDGIDHLGAAIEGV